MLYGQFKPGEWEKQEWIKLVKDPQVHECSSTKELEAYRQSPQYLKRARRLLKWAKKQKYIDITYKKDRKKQFRILPRFGGGGGRAPPDISHLSSLMVFNISYRTRKEELSRVFDRFGEVADVYIPSDRNGEPRGFAFVRFYKQRDAEDAKSMDGRMVDGRRIGVQTAKSGKGKKRDRRVGVSGAAAKSPTAKKTKTKPVEQTKEAKVQAKTEKQ